jgi:tRNA wybutosine-synthesizing protein 4
LNASDPNPWQCLSRYPQDCENVKFIDVDYMSLMERKCAAVRSTAELNGMLTNLTFPDKSHILLQSDQYLQIGCDLRDLSTLSNVLGSVLNLEECLVLCTAEVSITYMNVEAADALIKWACALSNGT